MRFLASNGLRRLAAIGGGTAMLGYAGVVGYLAINETSMVFAGAGNGGSARIVPREDAAIPWDTLRVPDAAGVPVLLLESRLDNSAAGPWVIYFHGNAGLLGSRGNVQRYRLLRDAGFNVFAVEFRGYGASAAAATPSEAGIFADATTAWNHLTRTLGVEPHRVVIYGWSLGSGPATYLAERYRPAALITEGAFTSLPDVGAARYPWVPVRSIMRNRFDNIGRAATLAVPWLVFHGRNDDLIPFSHGEMLAAASPRVQLVTLAAGHDDGVIADRDVALAALREVARRIGPIIANGETRQQHR